MLRLNMLNNQPANGNRSSIEGVLDMSLLCSNFRRLDLGVSEPSITEIFGWQQGLERVRIQEPRNLIRFDPLPASLISYLFAGSDFLSSNINTIIANCDKLKFLSNCLVSPLPRNFALESQLNPANINISHCPDLEHLILSNQNNNTGIISIDFFRSLGIIDLPNLQTLSIVRCGYDDAVTAVELKALWTQLKGIIFHTLDNQSVWDMSCNSLDVANAVFFAVANCNGQGNIIFDQPLPDLDEFYLSITTSTTNSNDNPVVDISGCTGLEQLALRRCNCSDLELPILSNPDSLINIYLADNPLDVATNPTIPTRISSYVNVVNAFINTGTFQSMNIGSILDLSNYKNLDALDAENCTGLNEIIFSSLLSKTREVRTIRIGNNSNLNTLTNLANNQGILTIVHDSCPLLDVDYTLLPNIRSMTGGSSGQTVVDLTNRISALTMVAISFTGATALTQFIFPINAVNATNQGNLTISGANVFTGFINFNVHTLTVSNRLFSVTNCAIFNQALDFTDRYYATIDLRSNAIDQSNIDSIIDSIYTNRVAHTAFNSLSETLRLEGGTNAVPTGIFQAPAGFVLGSNDGTPVSPQERIFVLVNNYGWTISTN